MTPMSNLETNQSTPYGTITLDPAPPADSAGSGLTRGRRPEWLRVRPVDSPRYRELRDLFRGQRLHTVCEEAMCPNLGECWGRGTATFLLMGDTCTRSCGFCKINTGRGAPLDPDEPRRIGESVRMMNLSHAVLTSVNRDEQPDGGAWVFAESLHWIRKLQPGCTVEVLIPDFRGDETALQRRHGRAPGDPQPQHRNGAPPLPHGAPAGQVHAHAGTAQARQGRWTAKR